MFMLLCKEPTELKRTFKNQDILDLHTPPISSHRRVWRRKRKEEEWENYTVVTGAIVGVSFV